jgi:hypothetical protein
MDQNVPQLSATHISSTPTKALSNYLLASWVVLLLACLTGLIIAIVWLPAVADDMIGMNIASTILGTNASAVTLTGGWFSLVFAVATGLANTFTACNCVVFSCIAPLSQQKERSTIGVARVLLWMIIGIVCVTTLYGVIGALFDQHLPSLSQAVLPVGRGIPVRLIQSSIIFVILGIILLYWGLATLGLAPNPFHAVTERHSWIIPLFLGVIVGSFSIGRPYPLFHTLFQYAASSGNILFSALLLALQGICNIAIMAMLFLLLMVSTGGRFSRWMQDHPFGARAITAFSVIGGGAFFIAYWGLRLPATFGIGWFPHI